MYGILALDKPSGPTSRDCVNKVTRRLPGIKVAHAGTLDPLARGVLVLLIGPAVRLTDEVHEFEKEYIGRFRLGWRSPPGDLETECEQVVAPGSIGRSELQGSLDHFRGEIEQSPPSYSAIRIDGKRAHELIRKGRDVEVPKRRVKIHELELVDFSNSEFTIRTVCSTGTYMRTLGSDIAKQVGSDAVMIDLQRTRVGPFTLSGACSLQDIPEASLESYLQSPRLAVSQLPMIGVQDLTLRRILDGQRLDWGQIASDYFVVEEGAIEPDFRCAAIDDEGTLRAIIEKQTDGAWKCVKGVAHWDLYPKRSDLK